MADMRGYDWLIGPGKALDPARRFLITSELFGNGGKAKTARILQSNAGNQWAKLPANLPSY